MRSVYKVIFKILGWKTNGSIATALKQYIMIVAPHTSNWDFFLGLAARNILHLDTRYVAKKELFRFPFGWIFKKLGGYPVDRSKNNNFVEAVSDLFKTHDRFSICFTPEGTRSYAPKWKTGFYYIALNAKIPIVMVAFDYGRKEVAVQPPFYPTGDIEKDFEFMLNYYRNISGKNPENGTK